MTRDRERDCAFWRTAIRQAHLIHASMENLCKLMMAKRSIVSIVMHDHIFTRTVLLQMKLFVLLKLSFTDHCLVEKLPTDL